VLRGRLVTAEAAGATAVHRLYWSAVGDQHLARRRAKLTRRQHTQPPDLNGDPRP
jgi:hypothetical protein